MRISVVLGCVVTASLHFHAGTMARKNRISPDDERLASSWLPSSRQGSKAKEWPWWERLANNHYKGIVLLKTLDIKKLDMSFTYVIAPDDLIFIRKSLRKPLADRFPAFS